MGGNTKNKRSDSQKIADKLFISKLLLKAVPYRKITERLNEHNKNEENGYSLVLSQIAYDIRKILEEWREERKDIIDLVVDRELKKLDIIEEECWVAWDLSKTDKLTTKYSGGKNDDVFKEKVREKIVEKSTGDTRYFDKILVCMARRQELLGYAAPKKVEFSGSVGVGVTPMTKEDMEKEKQRILGNLHKQSNEERRGENNTEREE